MVRQKNGAEWTMIEIFLNKLENSEALYKELAAKLNDERVTDSDGLTGHLLSREEPEEYNIYISDENVPNETIDEITGIFADCEEKNPNIKTERFVDEFLNLIDSQARMTRMVKPRSLVHRDGDLHPTVHIWLIKRKDMGIYVLLQKRSPEKRINPDCYDVSAAGHVSQGGEFRSAAVRELHEELGLDIPKNKLELIGLRKNVYTDGDDIVDNEMSAVYLCRENIDIDKLVLDPEEVSEVCWAEIDEMLSVMKHGGFKNCISLEELSMIKKAVF
ncbi:MAG: NUDIX domain-containing protein [Ruminococcus sp.]|nr:NUDIX domain-containing protein [Ruminococcus sp.]